MRAVFLRTPPVVRGVAVALFVALILVGAYLLTGGGTKTGSAYFKMTNSINPGDAVSILGIEVGKVDKLTPVGDGVRMDFHYDSKYKLPADVKAAILSPTLVATRFVQLDPAYTSGPEFPDGGVIPMGRTAIPVEFDELKKQLDQISERLGPNGVNKDGAINRALSVINKNGRQDGVGQGQPFHDMIVELSRAAKTLSDGRGDMFATVDNLANFATVLNKHDSQIIQFQQSLGDVSRTLDDNSSELRELLPRIDDAGKQVDDFLQHHGDALTTTIDRAGSVSRALAQVRDSIAQVLHVGPNALTNFTNLFHPRTGLLTGVVDVQNYQTSLASPGNQVCALITSATYANELQAQKQCAEMLGPLFAQLIRMSPYDFQNQQVPNIPLVPGVVVPHGSTPHYGDLDHKPGEPQVDASPNGTTSDLPRSTASDHTDKSYSDPGFPGLPIPQQNPVVPFGGK